MADKKVKAKTTKGAFYETIWGWAFALPTMIGLIVLNIYPIFNTIYQSFFKTGDFGKGNIFVGLENYQKVLADGAVWEALGNTFQYTIVEVPFSIAIALVLAVLLNRKMRGRSFYRTVIFLPMVCAPAAVAMVWKWIYNSNFGLINNVFGTDVNWISNPQIAIYSIAVIGIWGVIGYNMVLFIAGLQEVAVKMAKVGRTEYRTSRRPRWKEYTLVKYKEKKDFVQDNLAEGFLQMEKLIKEQPTVEAIPKEKVQEIVERLEEERTLLKQDKKEAIEYDDEQIIFATNNQIRAFDYSIRVVKEVGGME